jgi:hypothetical protein
MSHLRKLFAAVVIAAACLLAAAAAGAPLPREDLRYPFMPGGPRTFGVFELRVGDGGCVTAHRVAEAWMTRFEDVFRAGRVRLPRTVDGFTFTYLARPRGPDMSRAGPEADDDDLVRVPDPQRLICPRPCDTSSQGLPVNWIAGHGSLTSADQPLSWDRDTSLW